jgi:hypothetical protein
MKINVIQNKKTALKVNNEPLTLCDDESNEFPLHSLREEKEIEFDDLKKYFKQYKMSRNDLPDGGKVIDIYKILDQNKGGLRFLRVYLGVDDNNEHILCIAPIDLSKKLITKPGTIYSIQCCGIPPNRNIANFKGDPILDL